MATQTTPPYEELMYVLKAYRHKVEQLEYVVDQLAESPSRIMELEQLLESANKLAEGRGTTIKTQTEFVNRLKDDVQSKKIDIERLVKRLNEVAESSNRQELKIRELEEQLKIERKHVDAYSKTVADQSKRYTTYQDEISRDEQIIESRDTELKELRKTLDTHISTIKQRDAELTQLYTRIDEQNEMLSISFIEHQRLREDVKAYTAKIVDHETVAKQMAIVLSHREADLKTLRTWLAEANTKYGLEQKLVVAKNETIADLNKELESFVLAQIRDVEPVSTHELTRQLAERDSVIDSLRRVISARDDMAENLRKANRDLAQQLATKGTK